MTRKILLSFSDHLIRSYLIDYICLDWEKDDCIYHFIPKNNSISKSYPYNFSIENISLPAGHTEDEIWEIFDILYSLFKEKDEVYIDISSCPRIIEMMIASLLQYTKLLKDITVNGVYYCISDNSGACRHINLTAFSDIQDWGTAANDIIHFGDAQKLNKITQKHIKPILKKTCGQDEPAKKIKDLNKHIMSLSLNIKTNRGNTIIDGENAAQIFHILNDLEQDLIHPLNPILNKLKKSIEKIYVGKDEKENMLLVVQWCIDKSLIQEGFTLLQEGIVSYFLSDYNNKIKREITSAYLNYRFRNNFDANIFSNIDKTIIQEITTDLDNIYNINEWCRIYSHLTELRNDINHGGMSDSPFSAKNFQKKLNDLFQEVKLLINNM